MTLIELSDDLTRLIEEGYDLEIRDENLLVHHIPFLNGARAVEYGILVSELSTDGERTIVPGRHEIWVVGSVPHDHQGNVISILADANVHDYGGGLVASCRLSGKPGNRMPVNYHEKISNYVRILGDYARAIDPEATHVDYPARASSETDSVFRYHDAATSRSGLSAVSARLRLERVAIVGLGGTGSYVLDQVARTPVGEIHLYDDDILYAHNAFRAPGAASLEELTTRQRKVEYLFGRYDVLRRGIVPHPVKVEEGNVDELRQMDFVFLAIDAGPAKRLIIETLVEADVPFVDCGMGLQRQENSLRGTVRVTAGTPARYGHLADRISYTDVNEDEYDWNIQTADLNMLNAALAVIKWKKIFGYYVDAKQELHATYGIARNQLVSGDLPE